MVKYKVTLDNGASGIFEADSEEDARIMAQAGIDETATQFPDEIPPIIASVEVDNGSY